MKTSLEQHKFNDPIETLHEKMVSEQKFTNLTRKSANLTRKSANLTRKTPFGKRRYFRKMLQLAKEGFLAIFDIFVTEKPYTR